jgi:molybdenum cofactor cytidylyltransferase
VRAWEESLPASPSHATTRVIARFLLEFTMKLPGAPIVAAVLLAAGGSTRMGIAKQLIEVRGRSLVRQAAEVALQSRCEALFVVAGAECDAIRVELAELRAEVLFAENWRAGMSRSIRCGLEAVTQSASPAFDATMLLLVDQPEITPAHLDTLIDTYRTNPTAMVATEYAGTLGVPAVFGRQHFAALRTLAGDRGAKSLLLSEPAAGRVPFARAAFDIDTPDDLPPA